MDPKDDVLWYKDAIIYELHVKTFYDAKGNGIGNFKGLTEKLDYLEDLGVTALWLLPFYPSPLKDDGYDIADYFNIHSDYGDLKEFKEFLHEAHRRGLRVITELVVNHTSDQHAWFQRARRARPGSTIRNFYVWSDTPEKYPEARIIFKDFETSNWAWDPVGKAYYWHRFYSHQPDLNYGNPDVQKAILKVVDYWLNMGLDGMRLDAIPYLFEREGTNCENLPETYAFLQRLRAHVDSKFSNRMLLAEANQWPEDAVSYFGNGDKCHMAFHFPLMPRIFMAVRMEDRFPIIDILEQTPPIPETCQWALFLRNHDELTLEMVTDEERDYMYRMYARDPHARINLGIRRRLAPLLENDRRKIELMNILLFSLPGTPVIYYGDEIGMGDNYYLGDRNGVRTPMQWSADKNAGFSKANPQKLYLPVIIDPEYHYEAVNVENQQRNQASLLWWMKKYIAMRKRFKAFGRGSIEFPLPDNPRIFAFIRHYQPEPPLREEKILVVVNLSRHSQMVELNLSKLSGYVLEEVFSGNRFSPIKESPYILTLGPYGYYWFSLQKEKVVETVNVRTIPELEVTGVLTNTNREILEERSIEKLEREILPVYLKGCKWFARVEDAQENTREIQRLQILEILPLGKDPKRMEGAEDSAWERWAQDARLLLLEVQYVEGPSETYLLPISFAMGEKAKEILASSLPEVIARVKGMNLEGILYESIYSEGFRKNLLEMILRKHRIKGNHGEFIVHTKKAFKALAGSTGEISPLESQVLHAEKRNPSFLYGDRFFLKLLRCLEEGIHPDLEIGRFLTETASFPYTPAFIGAIEYRKPRAQPMTLGLLQSFVPNQGDAWTFTLSAVERYFDRVLSRRSEIQQIPKLSASFLKVEIPPSLQDLVKGAFFEMVKLLGKRTAKLHLALASNSEDPNFSPEPFSTLYQRSVYQSMRSSARRVLQLLRKNLNTLPESERPMQNVRKEAEEVLNLEKNVMDHFRMILQRKISTVKIRIHGNYHLGHVLYTGKDFVILDFESNPTKTLSERKLKHSPLRDVASMLRSLHYAVYTVLLKHTSLRPEDISVLEPWTDFWYKSMGSAFLRSYLDTTEKAPFIPKDPEELEILLKTFLLDKALRELSHELNDRPEWVIIPLRGIKEIVKQ